MKKVLVSFVCFAVIFIASSSSGISSVSAAPAEASKGFGCVVTDANGAHYLDPTCAAHQVVKFDNEGNLQFFEYQDHGTLPSRAARPRRAFRTTYSVCYDFAELGEICGIVDELVLPSGEYKSSFKAH